MSSTAAKPSTPSTTAVLPDADRSSPLASPREWTEFDYVTALARLENLQTRIDGLRLTVPTLVRTLASPHATPDALFKEFQKVTLGPAKALVELRRVLEQKDTTEIMEYTRKGFGTVVDVEAEGLGTYLKPLGTYGWVEQLAGSKKEIEGESKDTEKKNTSDGKILGDEEMEGRLKSYLEKYDAIISAEWDREGKIATVGYQYEMHCVNLSLIKSR
jgi:hypothetical protein